MGAAVPSARIGERWPGDTPHTGDASPGPAVARAARTGRVATPWDAARGDGVLAGQGATLAALLLRRCTRWGPR